MSMDLTDDIVAKELFKSPELLFTGSSLMNYLHSALELQLISYISDLSNYFDNVILTIWIKANIFSAIFLIFYTFLFYKLAQRLMDEIWMTQEMLNMIPIFLLEDNETIKGKIYKIKENN